MSPADIRYIADALADADTDELDLECPEVLAAIARVADQVAAPPPIRLARVRSARLSDGSLPPVMMPPLVRVKTAG